MSRAAWICVIGLAIRWVSAQCEGIPKVAGASSNVTGSSPHPSGTVLRYDCNIGYTTSGTSRFFTCSGNTWTGGNIQCDEILCPYIPPPKNGKIINTPTRGIGTSVNFRCDIGHVMSGASSSTCRADGQWSPSNIPPSCSAKSCGEFGSVQNADTFQDSSYTERNNYGAVVKVTCYRGYILSGSSDITCQADGTWGAKPTCEKITCPPYPNINSTCISVIQKFGTYIFLQCKEGENVSVTQGTSDYAECLDNGQWSNLDMACYCDCFLGGGTQTNITFKNLNSKGFLPHGRTLQWTCPAGVKQNEVFVQCENGQLKTNEGRNLVLIENHRLVSFEAFKDLVAEEMCTSELENDYSVDKIDSYTSIGLFTSTTSMYPATELITIKHSNTTSLEPSQETTEKNFLKTDEQSSLTTDFVFPTTLADHYAGNYDSTTATYRNTEHVPFTNTSLQSADTTRLPPSSDETVLQSTTIGKQLQDTTEKNFPETDEQSRMTTNNNTKSTTVSYRYTEAYENTENGTTVSDRNGTYDENTETGTTVSGRYNGTYDENTETGTTVSGRYNGTYDENTETGTTVSDRNGTYDENTETGTTVSGRYNGTYDENTETGTTVSGRYNGIYDENTETGTTVSGRYNGTYDENAETGTTDSGQYKRTYDENTETGTTIFGRYNGTYDENTETGTTVSGHYNRTYDERTEPYTDTDVTFTNKPDLKQHTDTTSPSEIDIHSTTTQVKKTTEFLTHCKGPPQVTGASSNVTGSPPYPSGTVLRYDCNIGYTTSGTSRFFKCSGNTWTGGNIQCDEILCPYIPPPKNGKKVNTPMRGIGTSVNFICDIGHVMSGASSSTCRADGQWSPSNIPPSCSAKNCGEFGSVQNADTFQDSSYTEQNNYGAVVKVTCDRGFILSGSSHVACQADGTWGAKPTCEKITCPPYPNINSTCISAIQKFGTYFFLQCKEGENVSVTQGTSDYAECLDNGQWSNLDMACYCDCFLGGVPQTNITLKNLNSKGFLPHGKSLQWTCPGGVKQSGLDIQCINGQLKINDKGYSLQIESTTLTSFIDLAMPEMCKLEQITNCARSEADLNKKDVSRENILKAINYNCNGFSKSSIIDCTSCYFSSIILMFNSIFMLI